jgi:hypothetical protein
VRALVALAGGADEHETGGAFGGVERKAHRDHAAGGVAEDHRALDAGVIEHDAQVAGEIGDRARRRIRRRAAVAAQLPGQHAVLRRERRHLCVPQRLTAGEPVRQDDRERPVTGDRVVRRHEARPITRGRHRGQSGNPVEASIIGLACLP